MSGFRPQFWPTVVAVPMLLICLGLGVWQVQRLSWKEGLIAARAAAVAAAPVAAPRDAGEARGMEFRP
ncbi:MAG: SURF1 family cytochrome oxidase biogenesis protein, partial [Stellaceae bacterium]